MLLWLLYVYLIFLGVQASFFIATFRFCAIIDTSAFSHALSMRLILHALTPQTSHIKLTVNRKKTARIDQSCLQKVNEKVFDTQRTSRDWVRAAKAANSLQLYLPLLDWMCFSPCVCSFWTCEINKRWAAGNPAAL